MTNWNGRNAIISSYWVCLFTKFRWRLHRALRLAWITWIPFILWFSMIFKIGLNIVHGFMNATFIDDSLYQWSLTINVHSCIYEHTSCMINDHRNSYEHWSSMIIDIDYDSWRSMIVAMKCCWSYMISVDHCIISWPLVSVPHLVNQRGRGKLLWDSRISTDHFEGKKLLVGVQKLINICSRGESLAKVTFHKVQIKDGPHDPAEVNKNRLSGQKSTRLKSIKYKLINDSMLSIKLGKSLGNRGFNRHFFAQISE